uniref:transcriptional regulator n=1 Tax=Pusillimonas sp. TaxID=3040095 RepID=UPI0037C56D48
MNAPINIQIINDAAGKPAFVVIPYEHYVAQQSSKKDDLIPHDVISRVVDGSTPARAWREHLQLTQADMAARLGIT